MGDLGGCRGEPLMASVVLSIAVVEMVRDGGLRYRDSPVSTFWETHLTEIGDVHSVLPELAHINGLRFIGTQRFEIPAVKRE